MLTEIWFDGSIWPKNPGGHGGYGVVVKRDGVQVLAEHGYVGFGAAMTNNVSEYAGVVRGLEYVVSMGWQAEETIVRGDSKLVVEQMEGNWAIRSGLYEAKARMALTLIARFRNVRFQWIPRSENSEADSLSKQGSHQDSSPEVPIVPLKVVSTWIADVQSRSAAVGVLEEVTQAVQTGVYAGKPVVGVSFSWAPGEEAKFEIRTKE